MSIFEEGKIKKSEVNNDSKTDKLDLVSPSRKIPLLRFIDLPATINMSPEQSQLLEMVCRKHCAQTSMKVSDAIIKIMTFRVTYGIIPVFYELDKRNTDILFAILKDMDCDIEVITGLPGIKFKIKPRSSL